MTSDLKLGSLSLIIDSPDQSSLDLARIRIGLSYALRSRLETSTGLIPAFNRETLLALLLRTRPATATSGASLSTLDRRWRLRSELLDSSPSLERLPGLAPSGDMRFEKEEGVVEKGTL